MWIKWECPACRYQNVLEVDLESKTGEVALCRQIKCGKRSAINFKVSVEATAALIIERQKELVGQA